MYMHCTCYNGGSPSSILLLHCFVVVVYCAIICQVKLEDYAYKSVYVSCTNFAS